MTRSGVGPRLCISSTLFKSLLIVSRTLLKPLNLKDRIENPFDVKCPVEIPLVPGGHPPVAAALLKPLLNLKDRVETPVEF